MIDFTELNPHQQIAKANDWVTSAAPGSKVIYYKGEFCAGSLKGLVFSWSEKGLVNLIQKRVDKTSVFEYTAIRTKKAIKK